eukprot:Gb_33062 [translate_table: standard]
MKPVKHLNTYVFRSGVGLISKEGLWKETVNQPGIPPDSNTYASLLQGCTNITSLKQLHAQIFIAGHDQNIFLGTKLVSMYAMWGSMDDARLLFDKLNGRDVFLWNVMIRGYATVGPCEEALALYYQMERRGLQPDKFTFPFVLKACASLLDLDQGEDIHDHLVRSGFESDVFVQSSLIDMYVKCGSVEIARQLFDKTSKRDVVSWTAMLAGYAQNGHASEALTLFHQMHLENAKPNWVTMVSVLPACADLSALQQGKDLHGYIIKNGFESNVDVRIALIDMYNKCGDMGNAGLLFDKTNHRDAILWNVMIRGYATNGLCEEALRLYYQMRWFGLQSDNFTFPFVLKACGSLSALQEGKQIHDHVVKTGFESDVFVGNSLVAMYAKCGNIKIARQVFDNMSNNDVASWSTMIVGYTQNKQTNEALKLFHQMQQANVKPNRVTFLSVLPAYADLAALEQGKDIHNLIIKNGFESDVVVGTALIDMYAKCGSLQIARHLFDKMSERNVVSWNAMIDGYGMHGKGEEALALFSKMQHCCVKPDHITFICVLSACSHAGLVVEGQKYFDCMIHDYCIMPREQHYACVVDLLGRAGHLDKALDFIGKMPLEPGASVWGALLSACKTHCNFELGECVAECLFNIDPENAGRYVLLSNIYAAAGRWDDVTKLRTMMKDRGLKKIPGCSLIEINSKLQPFHMAQGLGIYLVSNDSEIQEFMQFGLDWVSGV